MILSRISQHLKDQHWTAVFLDFVIVVFGVFIGLQVNNWNEARTDRALAAEYLDRLEFEVSYQVTTLKEQREYYEQARRHGIAADRAFDQPVDELDTQFLIDLYQASQRVNRSPQKGTYDELISTGRITLIGDIATRNKLRAHYANFADAMVTVQEASDYRPRVREEIDDSIQRQIREQCGDVLMQDSDGFYHISLPADCAVEALPELVAENVARLHANGRIRKLLRFQLGILDNRILNLDLMIESSRELKTELSTIKR